jgi:formylglycine-generating enzyme required for sulfatase activity
MGNNPSYFGAEGVGKSLVGHLDLRKLPVESVSFDDVTEFCDRLSQRPAERKAGRIYRLPTEAEWEYACRAGMAQTAYHFGSRLRNEIARFNGNDGSHPLPVGSSAANLFGLYDMHGNVWEWCADWYLEDYYTRTPEQNPSGPPNGSRRVLRGGGWSTPASLCRSAIRGNNTEDARHNYNGFRVALSIQES